MRLPLAIIGALLIACLPLSSVQADSGNKDTNIKPMATTIMSGGVSPVVSADDSSFNEDTGRYQFYGNVRITFNSRVIAGDYATISRTLWVVTQGNSHLYDGELDFFGDTSYAELTGDGIWFYGKRCGVTRPGLSIHADSVYYDWEKKQATFDGHVLCNAPKGRDTAADHLVYDFNSNEITR